MLYASGHVFLLARRAYDRAVQDSYESMTAIILAAVAFESFLNEIVHRFSTEITRGELPILNRVGDWLDIVELKRPNILERIEVLHLALAASKIDRGSQPYQDLALLYQLRNVLVHRKPESYGNWNPDDADRTYEPHRLVKSLASRGIIELPSPTAPPLWGPFVVNRQTSKWAFNTAVDGVHFLAGLLPSCAFAAITSVMAKGIERIN